MPRLRFAAWCLAAHLLVPGARADDPPRALDTARIDAAARRALDAWHAPGLALAVVPRDGEPYLRGYGVRCLGRPDPVTPGTRFPIASATKSFTAAAVAVLARDGALAWDDPVRRHLPDLALPEPVQSRRLSLRDALAHRSGLAYDAFPWYLTAPSRDLLLARLGSDELAGPPRSAWRYRNVNYLIAGEAAAKAAGTTWEGLVRERLLVPLGMADSGFGRAGLVASKDHATGHRDGPGGPAPVELPDLDAMAPALGIDSTARDLAAWVRFQLGDGTASGRRILEAADLDWMHSAWAAVDLRYDAGRWAGRFPGEDARDIGYGLGWFAYQYRGHRVVAHGGTIEGFRSMVALLPDDGVGFALLVNLEETRMAEALRERLIDVLLGLPEKDWDAYYKARDAEWNGRVDEIFRRDEARLVARDRPARDPASYVGDYESKAYGTARVEREADRLFFRLGRARSVLKYLGTAPGSGEVFRPGDVRDLRRGLLVFPAAAGAGPPESLELYGRRFRRVR